MGQCACQQDTLLLSAGEFTHTPFGQFERIHFLEGQAGNLLVLFGNLPEEIEIRGAAQQDRLPGRKCRRQGNRLRDNRQVTGAPHRRQGEQIIAIGTHLPTLHRDDSADGAYQRGFARSIRADQCQHLARLHIQRDGLQYPARAIGNRQTFNL